MIDLPDTASGMVNEIEEAILSLEQLPERGAERKVGIYANKGYRQLFVKNYTIVYRQFDPLKFQASADYSLRSK